MIAITSKAYFSFMTQAQAKPFEHDARTLHLVIRTVQTAPWTRWRESPRGGGRNWTGFRLCVPGDLLG